MTVFAVVYLFVVKAGRENDFESAWKDLTLLIYQYEGSLGSRLHRVDSLQYIAYAQWPDKATWSKSGSQLPERAKDLRKKMKDSCERIETLYEMETIEDVLHGELYHAPT